MLTRELLNECHIMTYRLLERDEESKRIRDDLRVPKVNRLKRTEHNVYGIIIRKELEETCLLFGCLAQLRHECLEETCDITLLRGDCEDIQLE